MAASQYPLQVVPLSNVTTSGITQGMYKRQAQDVELWARFYITPQLPNSLVKFKVSVPSGLSINASKPVFGTFVAMGQAPVLWHMAGLIDYGGANYLIAVANEGALQTSNAAGQVEVYAKYVTSAS